MNEDSLQNDEQNLNTDLKEDFIPKQKIKKENLSMEDHTYSCDSACEFQIQGIKKEITEEVPESQIADGMKFSSSGILEKTQNFQKHYDGVYRDEKPCEKLTDSEFGITSYNEEEKLDDNDPHCLLGEEEMAGMHEILSNQFSESFSNSPQVPAEVSNMESADIPKTSIFSCAFCGREFRCKAYLDSHVRTHTGDKPFCCGVCGKSFTRSGDVSVHMRIHTGDRPFACDSCGKTFTTSGNLKAHIRTHTGDRPFSCHLCGKSFSERGNLNGHLRTHSGARPYSCSICGKSFAERRNVKSHLRTHTDDRPFSCSICEKKFVRNGHLHEHMRIHTGDRPYSCNVCGKSFAVSGNLKCHQRTHDTSRPFACTFCSKSYGHPRSLKLHLQTHTSNEDSAR